jgi:hypothetical protein
MTDEPTNTDEAEDTDPEPQVIQLTAAIAVQMDSNREAN